MRTQGLFLFFYEDPGPFYEDQGSFFFVYEDPGPLFFCLIIYEDPDFLEYFRWHTGL